MEESVDGYLPYHIHFDKLVGGVDFNPKYADNYHKKNELAIFRLIYKEPYAFYLTEEDKSYYSPDALNAVRVVQKIAIQQYEYNNPSFSEICETDSIGYQGECDTISSVCEIDVIGDI